jgi:CheY-like chemotaxis protein
VELAAVPADQAQQETNAAAPPLERHQTDSEARLVLYIEDNASNLRLVERILAQRPGVKLLAAMQGGMGLDLAREHHPDLILLDINLPDMDGNKVLAQLQADAETTGIPVLVISADAMEGQIERLLAAGARGYLTKPIAVQKFLERIDEILQKKDARAQKPAVPLAA